MFNGENTALSVIMLIIFPITAYLIAGVNPAIVLSKLIYKQDIRLLGSKNPGFTNFKRVFGGKYAWFVFFLDLFKSAAVCAAAAITYHLLFDESKDFKWFHFGGAYTGFFAMIGHAYPVWYKFKGGKAFLVAASAIWFVDWRVALIATVIMMTLLFTTKYMSLSVLIAGFSCPIALAIFGVKTPLTLVFCILSVLLMTYRHKANIVRLFKGTESKFSPFSKNKPKKTAASCTDETPKPIGENDFDKTTEPCVESGKDATKNCL